MKPSHLSSLLFISLSAVAGSASAALTGTDTATIDFLGMNAGQPGAAAAYYGKANIADTAAQGCNAAGTKCYFEDGFSIGSVIDPADSSAHLHRGGTSVARALEYHGDSGGIYVRASDLSAFSLTSFKFDTRDSGTNPAAGTPGSSFEILGFNSALNADLTTWDWTANPTYNGERVAYQVIPNSGNLDTITLNDAFNNVSAFWIHYTGYPKVPTDGVEFDIKLSSVQLAAPAAVPVPAAVYLFGTGLMGFLAIGKRRRSI